MTFNYIEEVASKFSKKKREMFLENYSQLLLLHNNTMPTMKDGFDEEDLKYISKMKGQIRTSVQNLTNYFQNKITSEEVVDHKIKIANDTFEKYTFEDCITIESVGDWDTEDSNNYVREALISFSDRGDSLPFVKISFHTVFDENNEVLESYALTVSDGNQIGESTATS